MNTRTAADDSEFRQERFMSSPEMQRGLLANCVAARVQTLENPEHRKLIWFLQKASWEPGGLDKLAEEIMARWPERFATPSMTLLGIEEGRIYSADEVRQVRGEMPEWTTESGGRCAHEFLVEGELRTEVSRHQRITDFFADPCNNHFDRDEIAALEAAERYSYPTTYPASVFVESCRRAAERHFAKFLFERLCLDPAVNLNGRVLWYFPALIETLAELHDLRAARAAESAPVTEIGATIAETLEYALATRGLVVIDGVARTGKTFAVKAWCEAHPGRARYVQIPSANDDASFFRALCDALGLGGSRSYKAHELRRKVEDVLQAGDFLLVADEAHYCFPQRNMRIAVPHRINWLLTQLVNFGVPVALVTTPQFTKSQELLVKHGGWSSEQLIGRITHYARLPDILSEHDLEAVAKHWMPGGDAKAIRLLVTYAQSSQKYLQGIESLSRRARFLASKAGRVQPTFGDVADALKEGVIPSDTALSAALSGARPERRTGAGRAAPMPLPLAAEPSLHAVCRPSSSPLSATKSEPFSAPARDAGEAVLSP